jgi:DNA repair protein RecO (recombination protein O)
VAYYRDQGVVLRTIRLGEADRIVTLVTAGRGKVRAVAKGVRRTKSRFGARLEPTNHVAVMCWQGRDLDVVTGVEVLDQFRALREDFDRFRQAATMLEAADQLSLEGHGDPRLYQMLVRALGQLAVRDTPLVAPAFLWKALALEGLRPVVESCARCGGTGPLVAFDVGSGGARCERCRQGLAASPEALSIVHRILSGGLAQVLAGPAPPAAAEVGRLAAHALEHHLERRLRSLAAFERA